MEMSVAHRACIVLLLVKPWAADTGCVIAGVSAEAELAGRESAGCEHCNGQRRWSKAGG